MPRRLRFQPQKNLIHVVSTRCIQGYSLLRPSQKVNRLIAGILSRALLRSEGQIKLYAYVFMSNHYHLILQSFDQKSLSEFMQYLNQNLSRELGRLHDWKHHFWQSQYASHIVLDEEALANQFKYVLSNSVKEGLVSHPKLWPGLHCYSQIVDSTQVKGTWIDRTAMYNAKRLKSNEHLTEQDFTVTYDLQLSKPECWQHLSDHEYKAMITRWVSEICCENEQHEFMGADKVQKTEVLIKRKPKAGRKPLCKAGCLQTWIEFKKRYREFRTQYYLAACSYRDACGVEALLEARYLFPFGGFIYGMVPT